MNRSGLPEVITATRGIAVARKIDPSRLPMVAEALAAGGVEVIEVTLDGVGARARSRLWLNARSSVPERLCRSPRPRRP